MTPEQTTFSGKVIFKVKIVHQLEHWYPKGVVVKAEGRKA